MKIRKLTVAPVALLAAVLGTAQALDPAPRSSPEARQEAFERRTKILGERQTAFAQRRQAFEQRRQAFAERREARPRPLAEPASGRGDRPLARSPLRERRQEFAGQRREAFGERRTIPMR